MKINVLQNTTAQHCLYPVYNGSWKVFRVLTSSSHCGPYYNEMSDMINRKLICQFLARRSLSA